MGVLHQCIILSQRFASTKSTFRLPPCPPKKVGYDLVCQTQFLRIAPFSSHPSPAPLSRALKWLRRAPRCSGHSSRPDFQVHARTACSIRYVFSPIGGPGCLEDLTNFAKISHMSWQNIKQHLVEKMIG